MLRSSGTHRCRQAGVWFPGPPSPEPTEMETEKVFLHFPGRAFVIAFGHESSGRLASEILTKYLKADRFLWAQYRRAADEKTRFPAAVQDAVTYYHYILSLGFNPKNIILSGDSAGDNIVLALMRHLESAHVPELPIPGGAVIFSPWVEVTPRAAQDFDACSNAATDI